jgi:hypothetical protein
VKALIKTLIGDRDNALAVSTIVTLELILVATGYGTVAGYAVPVFVMAAAIWLARR